MRTQFGVRLLWLRQMFIKGYLNLKGVEYVQKKQKI